MMLPLHFNHNKLHNLNMIVKEILYILMIFHYNYPMFVMLKHIQKEPLKHLLFLY